MASPRSWNTVHDIPGFSCGRRPVLVSVRSEQRTEIELRLAESGTTRLLIGGRQQLLPARRLAMFWTGVPHQVLATDSKESSFLRLPLDWFVNLSLPEQFIRGILGGHVLFEPDVDHFECDQFRLRLWSDGGGHGPLIEHAAGLEVEARLWRLAATMPTPLPDLSLNRTRNRAPASKALETAAIIATRHVEPLSISDLGGLMNLHPSHLMKLFRRELGSTLLEYLTQHRLAHALRLLCLTDRPLSAIAAESGFGSLKRLTVTFRRAFKDSPAAFRRRVCGPRRAGRRR